MVDIEGAYWRYCSSHAIQNVLCSENSISSDSGIDCNSDGDTVSVVEEVDYFKKLQDAIRETMVRQNEVHWSRHYCDLPCLSIVPASREIHAAATGPEEGVRNITLAPMSPTSKSEWKKNKKAKGCEPFGKWTKRHPRAYGIGTSLYDCDPVTNWTSGDPVADVYAVVAGKNSCILALADGVNWGEKSRLAARCAVAGCLQYLSSHLYTANTTRDIMSILLKAFEHAQECIIDNNATMTTLCVAVVCQLETSGRWGLCVVNVGDSLAFTYKTSKGVQEVTIGSHYDNEGRDMRCPGGSLGPVDGYNPDLRNLTFSFAVLDAGDIVFLTSDGVSDNFDPVITQCKHCEIPVLRRANSLDSMLDEILKSTSKFEEDNKGGSLGQSSKSDHDIPQHQSHDPPIWRHKTMLDEMTKVIQEEGPEDHVSAMEVCAKLLSHVCRCTEKKRSFLEQVDRDDHNLVASNKEFRRARDKEISRHMRELPGKLDHAAVVAFEVGHFSSEPLRLESGREAYGKRRRSLFNDFISGLKKTANRRASVDGPSDEYEIISSSDSYTELYSLFGN